MSKSGSSSVPLWESPVYRVVLVLGLPLLGGVLGNLVSTGLLANGSVVVSAAPFLAAIGLVSWFLGVRWYGLSGLGLRGHRPLYAGLGFAVLGWVAFLSLRFYAVRFFGFGSSAAIFFLMLLFEAFAVQLWAFGLVFRAVADWRGPLTAAFVSGILFGMMAFLFFQESFIASSNAILYFGLWGILYGLIRLRTGGIIGQIIIQAMHSFTAWVVLVPETPPATSQLNLLYLLAGISYAMIIWRLWPKREEDYRV